VTALIVLAAGLSRRFGEEDKLLASVDGKPLAKHVVDALAPIKFTKRYVVIGENNSKLSDIFSGYSTIINIRSKEGQWRSIQLGAAQALKGGAMRAMVCLADMPRIPTSHYAALLKCEKSTMTLVENVAQPPAIFDHKDLQALAGLKSGQQGKNVLLAPPDMITLSAHLAVDIDRQEDLAKL